MIQQGLKKARFSDQIVSVTSRVVSSAEETKPAYKMLFLATCTK